MNFITKNKLILAGIIAGAITGYLYYYFIGCASGSCSITSHPVNSTIYGAFTVGLLLSIFRKEDKEKNKN